VSAARVVIHYHRAPDRYERFEQRVVARTHACVVTLLEAATVARTMLIDGRVALEPDAPVVWFTFPDAWHDIGRFHTSAGEFTGLYANLLTPVEGIATDEWRTTDLFLDLWHPRTGRTRVLDADELAAARTSGHIDEASARRARQEAAALLRALRAGAWPPPVVHAWTLDRARRHVRG
jgi:predicted RNA-binding protein associated with RNAse of E/G family